jgi:hypothetical protein
MKFSELDFTVEHRVGKKIPHVDALSRHVGAVLDDKNLRREVVRDEQAKKTNFVKASNLALTRVSEKFYRQRRNHIPA